MLAKILRTTKELFLNSLETLPKNDLEGYWIWTTSSHTTCYVRDREDMDTHRFSPSFAVIWVSFLSADPKEGALWVKGAMLEEAK